MLQVTLTLLKQQEFSSHDDLIWEKSHARTSSLGSNVQMISSHYARETSPNIIRWKGSPRCPRGYLVGESGGETDRVSPNERQGWKWMSLEGSKQHCQTIPLYLGKSHDHMMKTSWDCLLYFWPRPSPALILPKIPLNLGNWFSGQSDQCFLS